MVAFADPNFALYHVGATALPTLTGVADLYHEEEHEVTVSKTRQPLESGATLTDHAVRLPRRLKLQGMVSDLVVTRGRERAADAWHRILALADARTRFDVFTPIAVYPNMMLVNAKTPRNRSTGGGLMFTLELEEVLIVALGTGGLPQVFLSGPATDRGGEFALGNVQAEEREDLQAISDRNFEILRMTPVSLLDLGRP